MRYHLGDVDGFAIQSICLSPLVAEGLAFRQAMNYVISQGFLDVIFEVDSMQIVQMLRSFVAYIRWAMEAIIQNMKVL